jgi:hypothetical protein
MAWKGGEIGRSSFYAALSKNSTEKRHHAPFSIAESASRTNIDVCCTRPFTRLTSHLRTDVGRFARPQTERSSQQMQRPSQLRPNHVLVCWRRSLPIVAADSSCPYKSAVNQPKGPILPALQTARASLADAVCRFNHIPLVR